MFNNILIAMLFLSSVNYSNDINPPADTCDEPQSQSTMNLCAARDFKEADLTLNAQWEVTKDYMQEMDKYIAEHDRPPKFYETLLAAQRAWLKYRDTHCASYAYHVRGGSMHSMLVMNCKTQLTRERTKQLQELINP